MSKIAMQHGNQFIINIFYFSFFIIQIFLNCCVKAEGENFRAQI